MRKILIVIAIALAVLIVGVWIVLRPGAPPELPPLPDPNGYDELLGAQKMLNWTTSDSTNRAELEEFVQANAEPLRLAREALTKECRVPIEFNGEYVFESFVLGGLSTSLGIAMSLEADYLMLTGNTNAAARAYLDIARIGDSGLEGGIVLHYLRELAFEASALDGLRKTMHGLNAEQCREIASVVTVLEDDDDSFESMLEFDRAWSRQAFSFKERLQGMWETRSLDMGARESEARTRTARTRHQRRIRQMVLELAVRAFEVENGREPRNAGELRPDYLEVIPTDPETGKPLL